MSVRDEMTCEGFKDMAPAYALAVLDEAERAACARHLAGNGPHGGCPEALAEAREVTDRLSAAVPALAPSPRLWRAIEARIADVPTRAVDRRRRVREVGGWIVAAAAIALYLFGAAADKGRRAVVVAGGRATARERLISTDSPSATSPGDVPLSAEARMSHAATPISTSRAELTP